ncbi:transcription repressor OFP5-like [Andrographis paniculata]|uniref:transcription repressor OFP5-like n=1 Tax=Andrographis paniculata TaxID=175694 RepID=UPI0021E90B12|nr:transcription repressor OFP5-like [Andrographis paniculata]
MAGLSFQIIKYIHTISQKNQKMKWGRNKASSSSPGSIIARVLPLSWFFKFKKKRGDSGSSKQSGRGLYYRTPSNSSPGGWKEGRFYNMSEDDMYWRISFRQERILGRMSTGGMSMNPLWYDPDLELEVPVSGLTATRGGHSNFDDMVSDIKRMKKCDKDKALTNNGKLPKIPSQDREMQKLSSSRVSREKRREQRRDEIDDFSMEPERSAAVSSSRKKQPSLCPNPEREYYTRRKLLKDIKLKADQPQKTTESCSRKSKQHNINKIKAYSPRTECKIRALEDLKKSRMRWKKKGQGQGIGRETIFDSFAVMKSSSNPQQDFRDSMLEMIGAKGITRAEDLEELLACYLTLNCDAYHDIIVKVFRQVWSEIDVDLQLTNREYFAY